MKLFFVIDASQQLTFSLLQLLDTTQHVFPIFTPFSSFPPFLPYPLFPLSPFIMNTMITTAWPVHTMKNSFLVKIKKGNRQLYSLTYNSMVIFLLKTIPFWVGMAWLPFQKFATSVVWLFTRAILSMQIFTLNSLSFY